MLRVILSLILILLCSKYSFSFSGNGNGTMADPYQITNISQLQEIQTDAAHLAANYILMNDIDASITSSWNSGKGFDPIGDGTDPFTGSLDGQGFKISNMVINRSSETQVGLFGYLDGADISNLHLTNVNVKGNQTVGGLIGHLRNSSSISLCSVEGTVAGNNYVGGLCASCINSSSIYQSWTAGTVSSLSPMSDGRYGGFCGYVNTNSEIRECYSTAMVGGKNRIGGFCGVNDASQITDCYATGEVISWGSYSGGFIGLNWISGTITNCYSAGKVTGSSHSGGFCGSYSMGSVFNDCFWDTQTSGKASSMGGTGKTTSQMKQQATFTNWDFTNVWHIYNNSYPFLRFNNSIFSNVVPTMTEWAMIILGSLLAIGGGWIVWRKIV